MGRMTVTVTAVSLGLIIAGLIYLERQGDNAKLLLHRTSYALILITRGETSVNVSTIQGFSSTANCQVVGDAINKTNTNGEIETHCEPVW